MTVIFELAAGQESRRALQPLITFKCTAALRRVLDAMPRVSTVILDDEDRPAVQKEILCRTVGKVPTKANGSIDLHFHDLRGTAITMLSEAGTTPQQIAPITGHSLKTVAVILERYLARTRGPGRPSDFDFENSPRTEFANRLQTRRSNEVKGIKEKNRWKTIS